jgi:hypothetical protein
MPEAIFERQSKSFVLSELQTGFVSHPFRQNDFGLFADSFAS